MNYLGDFKASSAVNFNFTTHAASGAAVAPSTAFESADLIVYKGSSATQRTSASGITMTSPFDSIVGLHHVTIDLSDNTDAGFWTAGNDYAVILSPDETVDSLAVVKEVASFSIENRVVNWAQVVSPSTTLNLSGTTILTATDVETDTADIQSRIPAALDSGRMSASVGAMGANVLNASALATDAVAEIQSGLATQASVDDLPTNAELATALGTADDATLAAISGLNNLSAGQVRTELATELGRIDATVSSRATPAQVATALTDYDPPTKAEMDTGFSLVATAANLTALAGKFTGITLLARWLGTLAGKTADATTLAEITATTAGAGFSNTTDSLEAIRDRGDAAWTSAGGGGTTIVVTSSTSNITDRVQATTITLYYGENGYTIGPNPVLNDGDPVDLTAFASLRFTIEDKNGTDLLVVTDVTISGADDNYWQITGTSAATAIAPAMHEWSLRGIGTNINVLLAKGMVSVVRAADQDA